MLSPRVVATGTISAPPLVLVLGGQRSGKSGWAEARVLAAGLVPIYLATAEAGDAEMAARIRDHQQRRDVRWRLVEAPLDLPTALREASDANTTVLVDCLTLWLANLLGQEHNVERATAALTDAIADRRGPIVLVSNEVGSGVVPMGALSRAFVDAAGRLHQLLASEASEVVLVTAGIAQRLK